MNNNYNNEFMMKQQQQNLPPQNMFINPINNENSKFNEQPQFFNADTENNENILDTNNVNTNNEVTFQKQSEDFTKKINKLTQEKDEMNKKITELENTVTSKTNEVKKVSDLFDQLTDNTYNKDINNNATESPQTGGGIIALIIVTLSIIGLSIFCYKVYNNKKEEV